MELSGRNWSEATPILDLLTHNSWNFRAVTGAKRPQSYLADDNSWNFRAVTGAKRPHGTFRPSHLADETFGLHGTHMCESPISRDRGWVTKSSQFYKTTITFVEVVWENKIKVQTYANFRIFLVPYPTGVTLWRTD
jgi:hypothetical protein